MSPRPRLSWSPARAVQIPITLGATVALGWSLVTYGSGRVPVASGFGMATWSHTAT